MSAHQPHRSAGDRQHAAGRTAPRRAGRLRAIVVKVEGQNPTGSMKDRMAQAMVAGAERDGRLKPGGTIVEYTGGSTGASLALVAAAKGYRLKIVTSDAFSAEKLTQMRAFGAELHADPERRAARSPSSSSRP